MYESFYGFSEKPFSLLPDPGFLYESSKHRMAATMLEYGLMNMAGITVITGEVGSGKTTIIRHMLNNLDDNVTVGLISNTHNSFGELLQWVHMAFNLDFKGKEKIELYHEFEQFIIRQYAGGKRTVLIIDEAQNLAPETLEELRMLTNINADKDQVLQLVLVGQPELRSTLSRTDLRQFAQRISSNYHLEPLSMEEVRAYIRFRIHVAGGDQDLFEDEASEEVWRCSRGVPRLINTLCDTALVYGFAEQRDRIAASLIREVAKEKYDAGFFPMPLQERVEPSAVQVPVDRDSDVQGSRSAEVIRHPFQPRGQKRIRVALASDSQRHLEILTQALESNGMQVTSALPIREQSSLQINSDVADVLLVDLDESMEMVPGHLDYLFDNLLTVSQIPVLFNDGAYMDDRNINNDVFARRLVSKLTELAKEQVQVTRR